MRVDLQERVPASSLTLAAGHFGRHALFIIEKADLGEGVFCHLSMLFARKAKGSDLLIKARKDNLL